MTRREAVRQLGLLGVSGSPAVALLGAAATNAAAKPGERRDHGGRRGHGSRGKDEQWAPVATDAITFPGPRRGRTDQTARTPECAKR